MGVWMELRCENQGDTSYDRIGERCWSHANDGPKQMGSANKTSLAETLKDLEKDAVRHKWVKHKGDWYCPPCAKRLNLVE